MSIIMAAYNAEPYIEEAIASALAQEHDPIELIVVNDGSTDGTDARIARFDDPRLKVIHQHNQGIGMARNAGLAIARGDYLCFLDADDVMPPGSVGDRLAVFERDPSLSFVDGAVLYYDRDLRTVSRVHTPSFTGEPIQLLARFDPACFFGNTWMIRREAAQGHRFEGAISHVEDLLFYLNIAAGRRYGHTTRPVLHYRITGSSSMSRLEGLERSYHFVHRWVEEHPELFDRRTRIVNLYLIRRMMSGAYWHAGRPIRAVLAWFMGGWPPMLPGSVRMPRA
ncbi:MAG: glycosyltransferase family 2 protein [Flavobacteriales bacterium]|nr:glycosyltransferase family 2 protein [Flavobacteriales bacterium]